MILLQLSSAQGPEECCLAVKKALDRLIKEATRQDVAVTVLETETGRYSDTLRSALISLDGDNAWALSESDSAVRATHLASGISVKIQSERSQHANKRLARLLIAWKLEQQQQENSAALKSQRRMFHHQIERGNPRRTFTGMAFIEG